MTMAAVEAGLGSTVQPWAALATYTGLADAAKRFSWAEIADTQVRRVNAICSLSDDELSPAALAARVVLADCARELVTSKQWLGVKLI
jgi:LysR family tcuABC transcriptional regulator